MDVSVLAHLGYVAQLSLGFVFALSVLPKLRHPRAFVRSVEAYRILPPGAATSFSLLLIILEALVALAFLTGWLSSVGLYLATALLMTFLVAVAINLRRGLRVPCGCFGADSEPISPRALTRIFLLLFLVLFLGALRGTQDVSLPRLGSTHADGSALAYAIEATSLSAALILAGAWVLNAPELATLARQIGGVVPQTSARGGEPGTEGG